MQHHVRCSLGTAVKWYVACIARRLSSSIAKPECQPPAHHHHRPDVFTLDGTTLTPDEYWNISPHVVGLLKRRLLNDPHNPLSLLKRRIVEHFQCTRGSYVVREDESRVVSVFDNFDSLLTPADHVSRRTTDTYYINKHHCLRAHTSAHEHQLLKQGLNRFLVIGDVYRRDEINRTHFPSFHQIEGVHLYTSHELFNGLEVDMFEEGNRTDHKQESHTIDTANVLSLKLKGALEELTRAIFGNEIKMRWVDAYFPFTHPSFELEIYYDNDWMEVLGCGVLEQKLLSMAGVRARAGWAFGIGLERLAMVLYGIPDIRLFWSTDSGFKSQFAGIKPNDRVKYKAVSVHPQLYLDLSFWLCDGVNSEEMTANTYDLIRSVGGDLVEQVNLSDCYLNKKTGRLSQTYRLVYRSSERALTKHEVNILHKQIEHQLTQKYHVQIR